MNIGEEFYLASLVLSEDMKGVRDHIGHRFGTRCFEFQIGDHPDRNVLAIEDRAVWEDPEFQDVVQLVQRHSRRTGLDMAIVLLHPEEVAS